MYHLYRRTCGWILRYAYRTLWWEYVDLGCSGPGCIYGNVWCGSNFQGIFVIIREKKIWILRLKKGEINMAKKEERFEVTFRDGSQLKDEGVRQILVDKETEVNYLCWKSGYGAAITPLLDSEGKVIVTK